MILRLIDFVYRIDEERKKRPSLSKPSNLRDWCVRTPGLYDLFPPFILVHFFPYWPLLSESFSCFQNDYVFMYFEHWMYLPVLPLLPSSSFTFILSGLFIYGYLISLFFAFCGYHAPCISIYNDSKLSDPQFWVKDIFSFSSCMETVNH